MKMEFCGLWKNTAREGVRQMKNADFIIVTGLSGAGKSQAMKILEDLHYFASIICRPFCSHA